MGLLKSIPIIGGIAEGIAGAVQANQRRQRAKGVLTKAYTMGQQRLNLSQEDERQSGAESLVRRGLGARPGVIARPTQPTLTTDGSGAPVKTFSPLFNQVSAANGVRMLPGGSLDVGGATTLGQQNVKDRGREQVLEQTDLRTNYDNAMQDNNNAATDAEIASIAGGVGTALSGVASSYAAPAAAATMATSAGPQKAMSDLASRSYGGINPVNPLEGGAWAQSTRNFNVYGSHA